MGGTQIQYKHDFIKDFMKSCLIISDIKTSETIAKLIVGGNLDYNKLFFEKSSFKICFLNCIKNYNIDTKIVNCDCSLQRFNKELLNIENDVVIFNNINKCDEAMFGEIKRINGIYIC